MTLEQRIKARRLHRKRIKALTRLMVICLCIGFFIGGIKTYLSDEQSDAIQQKVQVDVKRESFVNKYGKYPLSRDVLYVIYDEAMARNIDPVAIIAQIDVESSFRPAVVSSKGAIGLMQIMPDTAKEIAGELGYLEYDLTDPITNVRFGIHYLSKLIDRFGNYDIALSAYFWGPTRVSRNVSLYEQTEYSHKVNTYRLKYI